MIDPNWKSTRVEELRGAWDTLDRTDVKPPMALAADNCIFEDGFASKRKGLGLAFASGDNADSLHNWVSSLGSNLYWWEAGTGLKTIDIAAVSPSSSTLVSTASGVGAKFANAGTRMYLTIYDSSQSGAATGRVISYQSAAYQSDVLFPGPITYAPSAPSEPSTGVITAGLHNFGYVIEYRSGFKGRLCPDSGATAVGFSSFVPVSMTAAGLKNLAWTLNTTWPTGAVKVYVCMTPVSNPANFIFIPGASIAVTGGSSQSVTITFNISDEELLESEEEDANKRRLLMTRNTSGTDAITPYHVFQCGDRMGYLANIADGNGNTESVLFVSERNAFQEVYPDFSLIKVPDMPQITTAAYISSNIVLLGKHATYVTSDTGLNPNEWPTPRRVDGARGTLSINGVSVSTNAQYGWVLDQAGLFLFDGQNYNEIAASYGQGTTWKALDWSNPYRFYVVDDPGNYAVYVLGQAAFQLLMRWDYRRGKTAYKVDYAKWSTTCGTPRSLALVQNDLNGAGGNKRRLELWVGLSSTSGIVRFKNSNDSSPDRDTSNSGSFAIQGTYQTGGFRDKGISIHHGAQIRTKGTGTLVVTHKSLDDATSQTLSPITMATAPGREYFRPSSVISEQATLAFSNATTDETFTVSGYEYFLDFYASKR